MVLVWATQDRGTGQGNMARRRLGQNGGGEVGISVQGQR